MGSPRVSRLEAIGWVGAMSALGFFLVRYRVLHPDSDPMRWFAFARNFTDGLGEVKLAYGFPWVTSLAIEIAGPLVAFSINVPILLILGAVLYVYARRHVAEAWFEVPGVSWVAGWVTWICFVAWNTGDSSMLLRLSNPYRDPLSYVLLLGATLALVRCVRLGGAWLPAAVAGALFALACSARETSILMAVPLALFAGWAGISHGRGTRGIGWGAALAFFGAFALAIVPLLLQNWMHSGSAVVPAQASGTVGVTRTYFSGLGLLYLPQTLPRVLAECIGHMGLWGLGLVAVGVGMSVWGRSPVALLVSLPAFLVYGVFYSAYYAVVPRYLFVLDLFAAPLAGVGAAGLWAMAYRRVGAGPARQWAGVVAGGVLAVATVAVAILAPRNEWLRVDLEGPRDERLRLADVREVGEWLGDQASLPGLIVSEPPLSSLLRTFFDYDVMGLMFDTGNRNLKKRVVLDRLMARIRERTEPTYYFRGAEGGAEATYLLESEFDLRPVARLDAVAHHLPALFPGVAELSLEQIVPWSEVSAQTTVRVPEPGRYWLSVDVGRLSRLTRGSARVSFDGRVVDDDPRDQGNVYLVESDRVGEHLVELVSDAPVPRILGAELTAAASPIVHDLRGVGRLKHATRLSEAFFRDVIPTAPVADGGAGTLVLPFPGAGDGWFQVLLVVSLMGDEAELETHGISIDLDGVPMYRAPVGEPKVFDEGWGFYEFAIAFDGQQLEGREGRLEVAFEAPLELGRPPRPVILAVETYRHEREAEYDLRLGILGDDPFVTDGFPVRDESAIEASWPARFTGPRARIPVFDADPDEVRQLRVDYLVGLEAQGVDPPRPRWFFNGHPLREGRSRRETVALEVSGGDGGDEGHPGATLDLVSEVYDVPREWSRSGVNELGVLTPTWTEAQEDVKAERQELGVLLHRVRFGSRPDVHPLR
ncbi:hypothetical protein MK489_20295 [Myxococcota bacterium]|nr:hypothetical protein [Myxococcota bacterium]